MLTLAIAALLLSGSPASPQQSQGGQQEKEPRYNQFRKFQLKDLQVVELKVGEKEEHKLRTWVMDTELKRQEGMMFLEDQDVANDRAMIFAFNRAQLLSFWMKNTYIPLDIAYMGATGRILKTYTMRPLDTYTDYGSRYPAKYALEMKQGTIDRLGMKVAQTIKIPDDVKAKD
ncbi:MAG TPA: DUF192 domain-containing protein [Fimbriimonadaceae bacterium]|nr:DUF192 domain-containing protein [Fimbriimonadaceae bacterium]